MAVNLSPVANSAPFVDSAGNPLSGGKLYFYTAGSSTLQNTYTTSAGSVANANPVILDSAGYPATGGSVVEIWLTAGVSYKAVLKTSADVTLWTRDNLVGINDTTVTIDQWVSGPTPTYISATSFSLVGDQTSTFQVGRRVKTTNSGGTIYSTINASVFGAVTTVTVINSAGVLDSGLSAVSYGLLSKTNDSLPRGVFPTLATEQASTSGTSIDFTGIPAGTKRITIMFVGVSTNGTSHVMVQLGDAGGFEATTYLATSSQTADASATVAVVFTTGFGITDAAAATLRHGHMTLTLENAATFTWVSSHSIIRSGAQFATSGAGSKSLSAELTQVRITTVNGTDVFDAGAINISYE